MQYYYYVVSLLLGLVVGSFLNVVICRMPRHESIVHPGSHCPGCGTSIRFYDNIPVLSWVILHGRCRTCRMRIAVRYPLVEGMTGLAYTLAFWRLGLDWSVIVAWAFIAALVALAFIDFDHMIIPNRIVLPGALLGLMASVALHPQRWWVYLAGSLGAGAFMFLLVMLWPGGMGPGDMKMALFMGAVLGASVVVALFAAFLIGSLAGIYLIVIQRRSRKQTIPFGPYLALGAVLATLMGQTLLNTYLKFYG